MPWLEQRKGPKNDSEEKIVLSEIDSELFLRPFLCSSQGMLHLFKYFISPVSFLICPCHFSFSHSFTTLFMFITVTERDVVCKSVYC